MAVLEYSFDDSILTPTNDEIVRIVYTRPLNEGNLKAYCDHKGIVSYLPLRKVCRLQTRRYKDTSYQYPTVVLRPMFPNYVFLKLHPDQCTDVFRSNVVVRFLGDRDADHTRLLQEIRLIRQIETIAMTEELEFNPEIREGSRFLIESGPWQGVCGWLKKKRKHSVWTVEIECVSSMVQATIDPTQYKLTPLPEE